MSTRKEWAGGKGDRPRKVDRRKVRDNFDKIDWTKKKKEEKDEKQK